MISVEIMSPASGDTVDFWTSETATGGGVKEIVILDNPASVGVKVVEHNGVVQFFYGCPFILRDERAKQ